jgi:hypothetical protein
MLERKWRTILTFATATILLTLMCVAIYPNWLQAWLGSRTSEGFSAFINSSNIWGIAMELGQNYNFQNLALPIAILVFGGLALLDYALSLPKCQRWLVWLNLLAIIVIIPWLLNLQALTHTVSGLYALNLNLFGLLLISLTKPVSDYT